MPNKIKKQMKKMKRRARAVEPDMIDVLGKNAAKYATPAAALGVGAATVTGVLMRERLGSLAQAAMEEGVTMAKH